MTHVRTQIRKGVISLLKANIPSVGGRVFSSRISAFRENELPAISVYTRSENSRRSSHTPSARLMRTVQLTIFCIVPRGDDYDDRIDELSSEVERLILTDTINIHVDNRNAQDVSLISTTMDFDGAGTAEHASINLTYDLIYTTREGEPDQAS